MVRKLKRGRPPTVNKNPPFGKKWCSKCKQFKWKEEFVGKDRYCKTCRTEYNKSYKRKIRGAPVVVMAVTTEIPCTSCGAVSSITANATDSGTWACFNCGLEWSGSFNISMRTNETTTDGTNT
jgi:hypothetical protein